MQSVFLDFGIVSILLVVAHLLRSSLGILQRFYILTPIIAGALGLLIGPQIISFSPFSTKEKQVRSEMGPDVVVTTFSTKPEDKQLLLETYPGFLVAILFGTLFLGARPKELSPQAIGRRAADTFFYNLATQFGQYGLALLIGVFVLAHLFPTLHPSFALMLPGGFAGGHGTITAISTTIEQTWQGPEAKSLGFTFATIGLLSAIFGGMVLINIAMRRGWTRLIRSAQELPEGMRRGFLPDSERLSMGQETVSPLALDPLGWHVALVLATFGISVFVHTGMKHFMPVSAGVPLFALAVLIGAGIQKTLDSAKLGQYVDRRVVGRIASTVSDYLVVCAIASIRLEVVAKYLVPIVLMSLFGIAYSVAVLWYVGRRIYHNFWFERSVFVYGWNTGVVATAIVLLRVVDPRLRTKTLEDYGISYALVAPLDILLLALLPMFVAQGVIVAPAVALVAMSVGCVLLSCFVVGWFNAPPAALRAGEAAIIAEQNEEIPKPELNRD